MLVVRAVAKVRMMVVAAKVAVVAVLSILSLMRKAVGKGWVAAVGGVPTHHCWRYRLSTWVQNKESSRPTAWRWLQHNVGGKGHFLG